VKERLAVFPLDGFASDETQEYIRFKLATARFTKELPIDGGIVGAIHNSSLGMPGAINSLVVDALNAAAPARERDEFADIGLVYSGDRIAQDDEHEGIEALDGSNPDVKISPLVSIQPRYWFAAATLVVMLAGTLLFGEKGPRETESIPISVAVTPKTTQAIEVEPVTELPAAVPEQPAAVGVAVAALEEFPLSDVADFDESNSAATSSIEEVVVAESIPLANNGAEINDSLLVVPADVAGPIVEIAVVEETVVIATASAFVEQLLQASPRDYAVQLLASYSEANISKFVAQLNSDHPAGYFETRYQGKPWFVAVLAAFDDRDEAARSIPSLSAKLRSNEPWARSVAGIQTDIQELLDSKLVSLK
jgi:septal ring-binding cell division protein DamX